MGIKEHGKRSGMQQVLKKKAGEKRQRRQGDGEETNTRMTETGKLEEFT